MINSNNTNLQLPSPPEYEVEIISNINHIDNSNMHNNSFYIPPNNCRDPMKLLSGNIIENTRLTSSTWTQNVRHIRIKMFCSEQYEIPGIYNV